MQGVNGVHGTQVLEGARSSGKKVAQGVAGFSRVQGEGDARF
jgi:hypothetical protein